VYSFGEQKNVHISDLNRKCLVINSEIDLKNSDLPETLIDSISQENIPAEEMVNLIYLSLKALLHKNLKNELVRAIYELRLLRIEGEYTETPPYSLKKSVLETWNYVISSPLNKLYTFTLEEGTLLDFCANVEILCRESFPMQFHSLKILKSLKQ